MFGAMISVGLTATLAACGSRHLLELPSERGESTAERHDSTSERKSSPDRDAAPALASTTAPDAGASAQVPLDPLVTAPSDFPPLPAPVDNPPDPLRTELGRRLFYDRRLSRTEEVACADCHFQEHAFADPASVSRGVEGRTGTRNAPALINLAYQPIFFWDGGVPTLELQVIAPIRNPLEMDMKLGEVAARLALDPLLAYMFESAFGAPPSEQTIPLALANFLRSLVSGNSAWDRYQRGEQDAVSDAAIRGHEVFNGEKGECFHCHGGFNFTSNAFRNNGTRPDDPDPGRMLLTQKSLDQGKFKVPTLRNIALTAPYMHDGSLGTLDDVIEHYVRGGEGSPNTDVTIGPLELSADDKADLRAFLESLTDPEFISASRYARPDD